MFRKRSGFTLIELLIVIAIIGILIASIAVAVTKAKEFANNSDQKNNMKQIVTACLIAEKFNNGRLPPARGKYGQPPKGSATQFDGRMFSNLLPYIEQKPLFDAVGAPGANAETVSKNSVVRLYLSACDPSLPALPANHISFVANIRVFQSKSSKMGFNVSFVTDNTADDGGVRGTDKISDGASNTIFLGTRYSVCEDPNGAVHSYYINGPGNAVDRGPYFGAGKYDGLPTQVATTQAAPYSNPYPPYQIAPALSGTATNYCNNDDSIFGHSYGSTPMAIAVGDSSVRNLSFTITGDTYARAMCPHDGQPLGSDW